MFDEERSILDRQAKNVKAKALLHTEWGCYIRLVDSTRFTAPFLTRGSGQLAKVDCAVPSPQLLSLQTFESRLSCAVAQGNSIRDAAAEDLVNSWS